MNPSFFNDLYSIIQKSVGESESANSNTKKAEFLFFLLDGDHCQNQESCMQLSGYDDENIQKCLKILDSSENISLKDIFGSKYDKYVKHLQKHCQLNLNTALEIWCRKNSPSFNRARTSILSKQKDIYYLYEKYLISLPKEQNAETLLDKLFFICVAGHTPHLFASYKKQELKKKTFESTLGRENDAKNLKKCLNHHHKIVISGQYGMGKSRFIKYCLNMWKLSDYCYIDYENDLISSLSKIRYKDINGHVYTSNSTFGLSNKDFASSLLIIDNMYSSPDFGKELEELSRMAINIIVITVKKIPKESFYGFYHYPLPSLSENILYDIFQNDSGLSLENVTQKNSLSDITLRNVLLNTLIALQCKKLAKTSSDPSNANIIQQVLNQMNILNNHMNLGAKNIRFKLQYDNQTADLIGHVKNIYDITLQNADYSAKETMKNLCCFGWSPIPLKFILYILPQNNAQNNIKQLEELSSMGFLMLENETIQLSPLISHAVFATENPKPTGYDPLVENLIIFLKSYDQKLDVPYLSNILYTFIQSLYNRVLRQNNQTQQTASIRFETWQELSYLIINYYNQNNATELAQKVNQLMEYPDSLGLKHNKINRSFFDIANKMQLEDEFDNMVPSIDKLIESLQAIIPDSDSSDSDKSAIATLDISVLIFNSLDNALNRYCRLHFHRKEFSLEHAICCLQVIDYIMQKRGHLQHRDDILTLSLEKSSFYRGCFRLITKDNISPDDFDNSTDQLNTWKNVDYKIRALAFIIFSQSAYTYACRNYALFDKSVLPKICQLNKLIQDCKIIPMQTFHLCLNAYIEAAKEQYVFRHYGLIKSDIPNILNLETCRNLFNRCNLTKEIHDEALLLIESVLTRLETEPQ